MLRLASINRFSTRAWPVLRVALGLLLLTTAGLKLAGQQVSAIPQVAWFASPTTQIAVAEWEILLGVWLLSGAEPVIAWLASIATFIAFAAVSFYLGRIGVASCGCFGALEASPWHAVAIDSAALLLLALVRPSLGPLVRARPNLSSPAVGLLLSFAAILAVATGIAAAVYGSPAAAVARLRGDQLSAAPYLMDFGEGRVGDELEATTLIRNWSDSPVRVVQSPMGAPSLPIGAPSSWSRDRGPAALRGIFMKGRSHGALMRAAVAAAALTFLGAPGPFQDSDEAALRQRLLNESAGLLEKAWARPVRSHWSIKRFDKNDKNRLVSSEEFTYLRSGGKSVLVVEPQMKPLSEQSGFSECQVAGSNNKYRFKLKRPVGTQEWLLASWEPLGGQERQPGFEMYSPHLSLFQKPLDKIMAETGWNTARLAPSPAGGPLYRLEFEYRPSSIKSTSTPVYKGWYDLDSAAGWCVRESKVAVTLPSGDKLSESSGRNEYELNGDGLPILRKVTGLTLETKNGKVVSEIETIGEYQTEYVRNIPESEFTLSAFGLPEPAGMKSSTPRYVWFLVGAGVCGALAVGIR